MSSSNGISRRAFFADAGASLTARGGIPDGDRDRVAAPNIVTIVADDMG